jgi:uncharacterized membrane protein HdeD (DUF308 family)
MVTQAELNAPSRSAAPRLIAAAGIVIILLGAGAALLPLLHGRPSANVVGWMLLAAGLVELGSSFVRTTARMPASLAGAVTAIAGLVFIFYAPTRFFTTLNLVTYWLLMRSAALVAAAVTLKGTPRMWTAIAAATDFLLGLILLAGLSISTLVVGLFGPTPVIIASFAWVLAISFVATGLFLLSIASCERRGG